MINKNCIIIGLLLLQPATETSCVDLDKLQGMQFTIPINTGPPTPSTVQPSTPQPPLPTDTLHPMSEWPPKKP